jgi:UDP-N-acetyl-D-glucosamine dehydrogenase
MTKVSVIGQGYVGLPLAIQAAEAGHEVTGYDNNELKILEINQGVINIPGVNSELISSLLVDKRYTATNDPSHISESDVIIIAVPTPLDVDGKPDTTILESATQTVAQFCKVTALIVNESTSYPGTLRNLILPMFKSNSENQLLFAAAPERVDPGNGYWNLANTPRVISGLTSEATEKAIQFYETFCTTVHKVSSPEVAEASKLFENTFRMVNIALANELAEISNILGFSTHEAIEAAATKPFGFMPFYPSIGVGGHCIPIDPMYLSDVAKRAGADASLIDLAQNINSSMPKNTLKRIKTELNNDLLGKRIQLVGIAYKSNISDLRESPAIELLNELRDAGSTVTWHDPIVGQLGDETSSELDVNIDIGLIINPHEKIDFSIWKSSGIKVLDLSASPRSYGWPKSL